MHFVTKKNHENLCFLFLRMVLCPGTVLCLTVPPRLSLILNSDRPRHYRWPAGSQQSWTDPGVSENAHCGPATCGGAAVPSWWCLNVRDLSPLQLRKWESPPAHWSPGCCTPRAAAGTAQRCSGGGLRGDSPLLPCKPQRLPLSSARRAPRYPHHHGSADCSRCLRAWGGGHDTPEGSTRCGGVAARVSGAAGVCYAGCLNREPSRPNCSPMENTGKFVTV